MNNNNMIPLFHIVLKFCTTHNLFKYLRKRYPNNIIKQLNNVVKLHRRLLSLRCSLKLLDK